MFASTLTPSHHRFTYTANMKELSIPTTAIEQQLDVKNVLDTETVNTPPVDTEAIGELLNDAVESTEMSTFKAVMLAGTMMLTYWMMISQELCLVETC